MQFDPERDPSDWQYMKLVDGYNFNFVPLTLNDPSQGFELVMSVSLLPGRCINTIKCNVYISAEVHYSPRD